MIQHSLRFCGSFAILHLHCNLNNGAIRIIIFDYHDETMMVAIFVPNYRTLSSAQSKAKQKNNQKPTPAKKYKKNKQQQPQSSQSDLTWHTAQVSILFKAHASCTIDVLTLFNLSLKHLSKRILLSPVQ